MELYQIRYFLALADTLNFTRASERTFVSQPALTKAIQRLEDNIGGRETPKRFAGFTLFSEDYVLAIGDDHRFQGRRHIEMAELDRERYCERELCEFSNYIERLLRARGVTLQVAQKSAREDWIQAFVRANFGVAFMPESIAHSARLDYGFTADVPIVRDVKLVVQAERPLSQAQRLVMNSLRAHNWNPEPRGGG